MQHSGERYARLVQWPNSLTGEAHAFVPLEHGSEFATIATGDETVTFADRRRNVCYLEAARLARMNGPAQRFKGFHEERSDEIRLEPSRFGLLHFLLHREQPLGAHRFLSEGIALKNLAKTTLIEGVVDALSESQSNFRLVAVSDRLEKQVLKARLLEDLAEDIEDAAFERFALYFDLFQQAMIDITLARFLSHEIPKMTHLLLTDAVDTAKPLFEAIGIPRQVVVDHQVCVLKVHAFTCGVGGDEDTYIVIRAE